MEEVKPEKTQTKPFYDLIYAGEKVEDLIKARWPSTKIKDASDFIHTERFECEIEGVTDDEFYPFAIKEGFVKCCFSFSLMLEGLKYPEPKEGPKHKDTVEKINKWIELAKGVKCA